MTPPWPGDPDFARQAALTTAFAADFARRKLAAAALNAMLTNPPSQAPIVASIVASDSARRALPTGPCALTEIIECDPSQSINAIGTLVVGTNRSG